MDPQNFSPMSLVQFSVAWSENFFAKDLTDRKSEPEVATTGRFESRVGALEDYVSAWNERFDSRGSGALGLRKSKMATVAPPEVEIRSTSGRRNMEEMVEEQVQ